MANDKDFKVKNGVQPTRYVEGLGTITAGAEGFSFSNPSYDSKSFSVASQETSPKGVFFKTDGTKMYVIGTAGGAVFQYGLSTAFDVSTASYDSVTLTDFNVVGTNRNGADLFFHPDGTYVFIVETTNQTNLVRLTLSTPWDLSTAGSKVTNSSLPTNKASSNAQGIFFKPDGSKMYLCENRNAGTDVHGFDLSTNWDISSSSVSSDSSFETTAQDNEIGGLFLNTDGSEFYLIGYQNDKVYRYTISTPYDISTSTFADDFSVGSQETQPQAVTFKPDGTKMYVVGFTNDTVYQYSTTKATDTLDLSTGSVFNYTPTASKTLKVGSPAASGTNSSATLLVNGNDAAGVTGNFSTTLYTGTGSSQTISNGIDLSGSNEGLVWIKQRNAVEHNNLYDTVRGATKDLRSNATTAEGTEVNGLQAFTSNGFTVGGDGLVGVNNGSYVAWTFKSTPKFFDVVTYTGNGSASRQIAHNLGSVPGMIIVKITSEFGSWAVYHRGNTANPETDYLQLNTTAATVDAADYWADTAPTSTHFTVGSDGDVNQNAATYVAYLFAHDTSSGPIQCGSYTGNASTDGPTINLGWQPQWIMIKNTSTSPTDWLVFDDKRGISASGNDALLNPNKNTAENNLNDFLSVTSTGFKLGTIGYGDSDTSGNNYIYVAIRAPDVASTTYDSSIKFSGGTAPASPAVGETDVITLDTTDGGTNYYASLAIDGAK